MKKITMKKHILVILLACVMAVLVPINAVAAPVISTILAISDFIGVVSLVWDLYDAGNKNYEIRKAELLAYWEKIIVDGNMTEQQFIDYWNECLEKGADTVNNPDYWDAYSMINESIFCFLYLEDIIEHCFVGGAAVDNTDTDVDDSGNAVISGDTFNDIVDRLNEQYGPEQKADRRVVSLQNPIHPSYSVGGLGWSNLSTGSATSRNCIPIRLGSDMLLGQDLKEVWFFPFVDDADNGMVYYCGYQYRVYHFVNDDQTVSLMADAYNCVDTSAAVTTYTLVEDLAKYPYVFVKMGYPEGTSNRGLFACFGFDSLTDFLKFYSPAQQKYIASVDMISSDNVLFSTVYDLIRANTFDPVDDGDDVGFITSQSKFNIGFMSTPLPDVTDNYYITINGDNIYEYYITNPDTGESTTIYNYITNNYYFPDSGDDDEDDDPSSGGTGLNWDITFDDFIVNIGDTITNSLQEFATTIGDTISTSIKNTFNYLFIPSEEYINNISISIEEKVNEKIPAYILEAPELLDNLFVEIEEDESNKGSSGTISIHDPMGNLLQYPKWEFTIDFFGKEITLIMLDFGMFKSSLFAVRSTVLVFVYIAYIWWLFRYIPTLIGGVADVVSHASDL